MFTTNYKDIEREFELFEGYYAVEIQEYEFRTYEYANTELQRIQLRLRVIEGERKGRLIFDSIFERVDDDGYATWDLNKINRYCKALNIPENTHFPSIKEWLDYIKGAKLVANVKIRNGYQNVVYVKKYKPTGKNDLTF